MIEDAECRKFARTFVGLLSQVDGSGRLPPDFDHAPLNALLDASQATCTVVFDDPVKYLGQFERLPAQAQKALLDSIRDRDTWQLRGHEIGRWYLSLVRLLFGIKNRVYGWQSESRLGELCRQLADVAAYGSRRAPADCFGAYYRTRSRLIGRFSRRPSLSSVFSVAGLDPRPLAVHYARPIEQPESYRGYWHDAARCQTVGVVLGIDFLPTESGFVYVESNVNFAQRPERSALYDTDPFVENMLGFTQDQGYRQLILVDSNSAGIDPLTATRYEQGATARDLQLRLVTRENVPESKYPRQYSNPPIESPDTLLLRTKAFPITLDFIADMKRASLRALECYQEEANDPALILPASSTSPVLGQVDPDEPFPNVVYKLPEIDQARGVYFLKAESTEHAEQLLGEAINSSADGSLQARLQRMMNDRNGLYQAYYKSRMLQDRRLYVIRAHVLVSPVGVRFLSAHRVISGQSVPMELSPGIIADPSPYLVNYSAGSWYEVVPDDEEAGVARASEAVGRGLAKSFEYALSQP